MTYVYTAHSHKGQVERELKDLDNKLTSLESELSQAKVKLRRHLEVAKSFPNNPGYDKATAELKDAVAKLETTIRVDKVRQQTLQTEYNSF